jgi:hypothetical protein
VIDWAPIQGGLLNWFAETSEVPAVWEQEEREFMSGGAFVSLNITAFRSVGVDETRYEHDPDTDQLIPVQHGMRMFTLTVSAESQDPSAGEHAAKYLEELRTRIRTPWALETIQGLGLALVDTTSLLSADYVIDERVVSKKSFDVRFMVAEEYRPEDQVGLISTVELTSQASGEDGELLQASQQITEETIP